MIIPIGHDQLIRRWPYVTAGIIVLCTLIQVWASFIAPSPKKLASRAIEIAMRYQGNGESEMTPEDEQAFERDLGKLLDERPEHRLGYRTGEGVSFGLLTSAFVHGGWFHLIGNMLFLFLAGSALEDRYGHVGFGIFYLFGAATATYAFSLSSSESGVLLIGASGAVSACMGAFLLHFHRAQIRFWYFLMMRTGTFQWPAWFALPLWLGEQFLWASFDGGTGRSTGVAYSAHIAGFIAGFAVGFIMNWLYPPERVEGEGNDAELPVARVEAGAARDEASERIDRFVQAIDASDKATVRTLGSRVLLDLARAERTATDQRLLELYDMLAGRFTQLPLTDGAFAAAASAADRLADPSRYTAIAGAMIAEHPGSAQTAKVMWRLAQLQNDAGDSDLARETLRLLAERFPRDPVGQKARATLT